MATQPLTPQQQKAAAEQALAQMADLTKRAYVLGFVSNCMMYGADPTQAGQLAEEGFKQACARYGRIKQATKTKVVSAIKAASAKAAAGQQ